MRIPESLSDMCSECHSGYTLCIQSGSLAAIPERCCPGRRHHPGHQRGLQQGLEDVGLLAGSLLMGADLALVALQAVLQGGVLRLRPADEDAPVDLGLDLTRPRLSVGAGHEGFDLGREALAGNTSLPLQLATFAE